jgi:phage baseplate assembly protein W
MMDIDFPYAIDGRGRTALTTGDAHIRDLIEQLLFTSPGERVNRPGFGSGLLQLVFAPASPEMAATTQFLVQASLQQWLGERVQIDDVAVSVDDATVTVTVVYTARGEDETRTATFARTA